MASDPSLKRISVVAALLSIVTLPVNVPPVSGIDVPNCPASSASATSFMSSMLVTTVPMSVRLLIIVVIFEDVAQNFAEYSASPPATDPSTGPLVLIAQSLALCVSMIFVVFAELRIVASSAKVVVPDREWTIYKSPL